MSDWAAFSHFRQLHAHNAKQNEPHGILQVFTPSYSKWDPSIEMDRWENHEIEIFTEDGERVRGWWHRKPIRLRPGNYVIRIPGIETTAIPVTVCEAKTKHLVVESPGETQVKVLE